MKSGLAKIVLMSSAISTAAALGDYFNVCDRFVNPFYYRNVPVAEGFYKQPFGLHKQYRISKEGSLEIYFGDVEMYPVTDSLRVNERKFGELLKEKAKVWIKEGGKRLDQLVYMVGKFSRGFFGEPGK